MPLQDNDISYEAIVIASLSYLSVNSPLTDVNPGSVVRTLVEAMSRELANAYAAMSVLYDMGFIDTASGDSLNHLVSMFGLLRLEGPIITGQVRIYRDPNISTDVVIPPNALLSKVKLDTKSVVHYRTANEKTVLKAGQQSITVGITADVSSIQGITPVEVGAADALLLTQDDIGNGTDDQSLMTLETPVIGVTKVRLLFPTTVQQLTETDAELRARAKNKVSAAGGGTEQAIRQAVLNTGYATEVTISENTDPQGVPGQIVIYVNTDLTSANKKEILTDAINHVKAVGVSFRIEEIAKAKVSVHIKLTMNNQVDPKKTDPICLNAVHAAVAEAHSLQLGQPLVWNKIVSRVMHIPGIEDISGGLYVHTEEDVSPDSQELSLVNLVRGQTSAQKIVLAFIYITEPTKLAFQVSPSGQAEYQLTHSMNDQLIRVGSDSPAGGVS